MKYTLQEEYDFDFTLIGISCHAKDYRVCWSINRRLGFDLEKQKDDLEMVGPGNEEPSKHSLFSYYDEVDKNEYILICNRNGQGFLIPEERNSDFMLLVKGAIPVDANKLSKELKEIEQVLTAFPINVKTLKSKKNLIF